MPNRLAGATSPYLLQHAENPVDWREGGGGAFAAAPPRDRPPPGSGGRPARPWRPGAAQWGPPPRRPAADLGRLRGLPLVPCVRQVGITSVDSPAERITAGDSGHLVPRHAGTSGWNRAFRGRVNVFNAAFNAGARLRTSGGD